MLTSITALVLSLYLANPFITLAQGSIESNLNRFAVGKMNEQGAYQVRESIWGKTPRTFHGQTKQYEDIMETLLVQSKGDVWEAVGHYNGSGLKADQYVWKVQKRALQIAML